MTDNFDTRPSFSRDPLGALFDPRTWEDIEKNISHALDKVFRGIALDKEVEVLKEATETEPAKVREILVGTLEIPGVRAEDVSVKFSKTEFGFNRLTVTTVRDGDVVVFKEDFREAVVTEEAVAAVALGVLTVRVPVDTEETDVKVEVKAS